jgi:hypothetical protein
MIFRDIHNGTLLNVRRDDFVNDRKYFQEIIRIAKETSGDKPLYTCPFEYITDP